MGEVQGKKWSKSPLEIVRDFFPDVNDDHAECILWERTGWPAFWGGDPETVLRRQLQELKDAPAGRLCDFCNKLAVENGTLCVDCEESWRQLHVEQSYCETYEWLAFARGQMQRALIGEEWRKRIRVALQRQYCVNDRWLSDAHFGAWCLLVKMDYSITNIGA